MKQVVLLAVSIFTGCYVFGFPLLVRVRVRVSCDSYNERFIS